MIAFIAGTLLSKEADHVVVKTASGVGYEVFVPTRALASLPPEGRPVELYTHLAVREDAHTLYGFESAAERRVFQRLMTASGVGPKMALAMLSALSGARIVRAIREKDLAALTSVPGVGKKTAERLVFELADKTDGLEAEPGLPGVPHTTASEAATKALVRLGYTAAEADDAVRHVLAANGAGGARDTADLVKTALSFLGGR
jgi:holliday junction DNA helicase RuvA